MKKNKKMENLSDLTKDLDNTVKGERMIADSLAIAKVDTTEVKDSINLSMQDTVIMNLSNAILKQLEKNNEYLYNLVDQFIGDDLMFKVSLDTDKNIATMTLEATAPLINQTTKRMFKQEYDSSIIGERHLPSVIQINNALIQATKDILANLNVPE